MSDEQAPLIITCTCGQKMKVPAGAAGKTYKCVKCGERLRVTESGSPIPKGDGNTSEKVPEAIPERIGQMLIDEGLITPEQLREALEVQRKQGGKTFELLIRLGHLNKNDLHAFLSRQPGVATIDLHRVQIDRKLPELIPRGLALEYLVLPIDRLGKLLTVGMACPLDRATIQKMEELTGLKVKAVLCKLDDIHAAVNKYYPAEKTPVFEMPRVETQGGPAQATKTAIAEELARLEDIPGDLEMSDRLRSLARDPNAEMQSMSVAATADPALAAALLRAANSPACGIPGRVDSVAMAVALLGREGVLAALEMRGNAQTTYNITLLRRQSLRCAAIAAALAKACGRVGPGAAHTAGLLHLLGAYALAVAAPGEYRMVNAELTGFNRVSAELQSMGISHPEAGMNLASRWRLPDTLCAAIHHYLAPERTTDARALASVVSISAVLAGAGDFAHAPALAPCKNALDYLGLDAGKALQSAQATVRP